MYNIYSIPTGVFIASFKNAFDALKGLILLCGDTTVKQASETYKIVKEA